MLLANNCNDMAYSPLITIDRQYPFDIICN